MRLALVVLLGACNEWYGLDKTRPLDASVIPPDAAPECFADRAPYFDPTTTQPVLRGSSFALTYNVDASHTIAIANRLQVVAGPPDSEDVAPIDLEPDLPMGSKVEYPRLAPEGDELFARVFIPLVGYQLSRYTREGNVWRFAAKLSIVIDENTELSNPTRALPGGRRIFLTEQFQLQEYIEVTPDQWMPTGPRMPMIGEHPTLTPDGLRLIYANPNSPPGLRYLTRDNVTQPFVNAIDFNPFFGKPRIAWPFLTPDCGRLYGLVIFEGVYYVEQR